MPVICLSPSEAAELDRLTALELSALEFWKRVTKQRGVKNKPKRILIIDRVNYNTFNASYANRKTNAPRPSADI